MISFAPSQLMICFLSIDYSLTIIMNSSHYGHWLEGCSYCSIQSCYCLIIYSYYYYYYTPLALNKPFIRNIPVFPSNHNCLSKMIRAVILNLHFKASIFVSNLIKVSPLGTVNVNYQRETLQLMCLQFYCCSCCNCFIHYRLLKQMIQFIFQTWN